MLGNRVEPEQIAARLFIDFPDDEDMRISHGAIYQALFIQGRGALKREWLPEGVTGAGAAACDDR